VAWGKKTKPKTLLLVIALKTDCNSLAQVAISFKGKQRSGKNSHVHFKEFLLSDQKSHEFYSVFLTHGLLSNFKQTPHVQKLFSMHFCICQSKVCDKNHT